MGFSHFRHVEGTGNEVTLFSWRKDRRIIVSMTNSLSISQGLYCLPDISQRDGKVETGYLFLK